VRELLTALGAARTLPVRRAATAAAVTTPRA
jgi:hypothetical protein